MEGPPDRPRHVPAHRRGSQRSWTPRSRTVRTGSARSSSTGSWPRRWPGSCPRRPNANAARPPTDATSRSPRPGRRPARHHPGHRQPGPRRRAGPGGRGRRRREAAGRAGEHRVVERPPRHGRRRDGPPATAPSTSPTPPPTATRDGRRDAATPGASARGRRQVVLYVHLSELALSGGSNVGRCENTQAPVTTEQIRSWCATPDAIVTVKPVIDLNDHVRVDAYEVPDRMREAAVLTDLTCVFPWCTRKARRCDCDHCRSPRRGRRDRQSQHRAAVPTPSPAQDPRRLALRRHRARHLPVDQPVRLPVAARPPRHHRPHPQARPRRARRRPTTPAPADDPDRPTPRPRRGQWHVQAPFERRPSASSHQHLNPPRASRGRAAQPRQWRLPPHRRLTPNDPQQCPLVSRTTRVTLDSPVRRAGEGAGCARARLGSSAAARGGVRRDLVLRLHRRPRRRPGDGPDQPGRLPDAAGRGAAGDPGPRRPRTAAGRPAYGAPDRGRGPGDERAPVRTHVPRVRGRPAGPRWVPCCTR